MRGANPLLHLPVPPIRSPAVSHLLASSFQANGSNPIESYGDIGTNNKTTINVVTNSQEQSERKVLTEEVTDDQ